MYKTLCWVEVIQRREITRLGYTFSDSIDRNAFAMLVNVDLVTLVTPRSGEIFDLLTT